MHHLLQGVHPGIGAPRAHHAQRGAGELAQRPLDVVLHGGATGLAEPALVGAPAEPAQALDTRLALVEESRAMGDLDTARHLLHEIIAESDGETRAAAEKLLAQLG